MIKVTAQQKDKSLIIKSKNENRAINADSCSMDAVFASL